MMDSSTPIILAIGESGFPIGFGAVQRQLLILKGLQAQGYQAKVICYKGVHNTSVNIPPKGELDGLEYEYLSNSVHKPTGFFNRNWQKIKGKYKEFALISRLKRTEQLQACYVSTLDFKHLFLYRIWLKIKSVPLILDYCELNSAIASRKGIKRAINDYLFDRLAPRLCDGICPISAVLIEEVGKHAPQKPLLKMPILCDFDKFNLSPKRNEVIRLTYCGAASYMPLIQFVLDAFDKVEIGKKQVELAFILGGKSADLERVQTTINQSKNKAFVQLNANLPHHEIPKHYAKANALLIPLRPTLQDAARFPHKLGEYLSSQSCVITTAFGEIQQYDFIDGENVLVAKEYSPDSFAAKMQYVIDHPDKANDLGKKGRQMAIRNFDYKMLGERLGTFIKNI